MARSESSAQTAMPGHGWPAPEGHDVRAQRSRSGFAGRRSHLSAGPGALTAPLVAAGARVVAVELHPHRAQALRERFAACAVTVVQADASDLRLPRRPFKVVANPPFAVSTAILRRLLHPTSRLVRADLVLPRQVAARWAGGRAPAARRWTMTFDARVGGHLRPSS